MVTLVISDSWDVTADLVIRRIGDSVFRLNSDLIRDYKIVLNRETFSISNPAGRRVCAGDVTGVYWRKPFTQDAYSDPKHPDAYFHAESKYLIREIYNLCVANGAKTLVEEGAERRLGKICQLKLASSYFPVPEWQVILGEDFEVSEGSLVKSLSGEPLDESRVIYTTDVSGSLLDEKYIWLVQRRINKIADVTVVFVEGKIFSFKYENTEEKLDWRENIPHMSAGDWSDFVWGIIRLTYQTPSARFLALEDNGRGQVQHY